MGCGFVHLNIWRRISVWATSGEQEGIDRQQNRQILFIFVKIPFILAIATPNLTDPLQQSAHANCQPLMRRIPRHRASSERY